jgi:NAD(P)-dependent dehydrogenase (short-subunit alcohol dehydrogenase family)
VALINKAGGQAMTLTGDVTDTKVVEATVKSVVAAYGRLDCAFNNAGIAGFQVDASGQKTADWSEAAFDRMIAVNLKGVWLCMKHELNQMVAQGGGAIVNTASIAGLIGLPTSSAYVAAKHGVVGLTKTAALEYADDKVRVNAVCPGYIETKMTEDTMRRRGAELMAKVPFHRLGKPEEIAQMVAWLCSDRASYVSGAAYNVDGGYMATWSHASSRSRLLLVRERSQISLGGSAAGAAMMAESALRISCIAGPSTLRQSRPAAAVRKKVSNADTRRCPSAADWPGWVHLPSSALKSFLSCSATRLVTRAETVRSEPRPAFAQPVGIAVHGYWSQLKQLYQTVEVLTLRRWAPTNHVRQYVRRGRA